jgi:hypothetical protein
MFLANVTRVVIAAQVLINLKWEYFAVLAGLEPIFAHKNSPLDLYPAKSRHWHRELDS